MQIPKIIHYCWFGRGQKPKSAFKCIASWHKFLPDYEIKEWNEDNFDIKAVPYVEQAYKARRWAFVSDYARFAILYKHGGIYFDTDVEVIRPLDDILEAGPFMGLESSPYMHSCFASEKVAVASGLGMAVSAGHPLYRDVLDIYRSLRFDVDAKNPTTVVAIVSGLMVSQGFALKPGIIDFKGIKIYPPDYFNPKPPYEKLRITKNSRTIHHCTGSWGTPRQRFLYFIGRHFGRRMVQGVSLIMHNPLYIVKRIRAYLKTGR